MTSLMGFFSVFTFLQNSYGDEPQSGLCATKRGLGTWVTSFFLMSRLSKRMNHPISFPPGKEKRKERASEVVFD